MGNRVSAFGCGTEEETQLDGLMCSSNNAYSYGDTTEQASQSNSLIAFELL